MYLPIFSQIKGPKNYTVLQYVFTSIKPNKRTANLHGFTVCIYLYFDKSKGPLNNMVLQYVFTYI